MLRKIMIAALIIASLCTVVLFGCTKEIPELPQEPVYYTISYSVDNKRYTLEVEYGKDFRLQNIPNKEGFVFIGLFDSEDGGIKYTDNNGYSTIPYGKKSDATLYPQYTVKTFTFKFNYGESGDSLVSSEVNYGDTLLSPPKPAAVYGREFKGWYTEANCKGTNVDIAVPIDYNTYPMLKNTYSITLYAGYEDIYYDLELYVGDFKIVSEKLKCGSSIEGKLVKKLSDGAVIAEWSESPNGYPCNYTVIEKNLKLYAVKFGYKIVFNTDGGNTLEEMIGYEGYYTQLPTPTKQYCDFLGWVLDGKNIGTNLIMPKKHISLTASWKRSCYLVHYNTDGGNEIESAIVRVGNSIPQPQAVKQYNSFEGWLYNSNPVDNTIKMPANDIELKAQWKRTHYLVNYNTDGGNEIESAMVSVGNSIPQPQAEKHYNSFEGWLYNSKPVDDTIKMPANDIELTAQWKRTHYSITILSSLDGSLIKKDWVLNGDIYIFNVPVVIGYNCIGVFNAQGKEQNLIEAYDGDRTLTARFEPMTFDVAYNYNGGTVAGNPVGTQVKFNSPYKFAVPQRSGYIFYGWYSSDNKKLTDHNGIGLANWSITGNTAVEAHYVTNNITFFDDTRQKITDSGYSNQYHDTLALKDDFGLSIAEYIALGCKTMTFDITIEVSEIDDGYQKLCINNIPKSYIGNVYEVKFEHTYARTDKSIWAHRFNVKVDLNKLSDIMYVSYSAEGAWDDDWYRHSLKIVMTIT